MATHSSDLHTLVRAMPGIDPTYRCSTSPPSDARLWHRSPQAPTIQQHRSADDFEDDRSLSPRSTSSGGSWRRSRSSSRGSTLPTPRCVARSAEISAALRRRSLSSTAFSGRLAASTTARRDRRDRTSGRSDTAILSRQNMRRPAISTSRSRTIRGRRDRLDGCAGRRQTIASERAVALDLAMPGDVLARDRGNRRRIGAVVPRRASRRASADIARDRTDVPHADARYLAALSLGAHPSAVLRGAAHEAIAARSGVNLGDLRTIAGPDPAARRAAQHRRRGRAASSRSSTPSATQIERALRRSAALRRVDPRAAFAGELVPQDPADEPASVLLERIAERARSRQGHATRAGRCLHDVRTASSSACGATATSSATTASPTATTSSS